MEIRQDALSEFVDLYNTEFNEDIDPDEALVIARNLVMFYEELYDKRVFQTILEKERAASASESVPKD